MFLKILLLSTFLGNIVLCSKNITFAIRLLILFIGIDIFNLKPIIGFELPFSTILIFSIWLYYFLTDSKKLKSDQNIVYAKYLILILLILGFIIPFTEDFKIWNYNFSEEISGYSPIQECIKNTFYLLIVYLFIDVYLSSVKRGINIKAIIISTLPLTTWINFASLLFLFFQIGAPAFIVSKSLIESGIIRYSATFSDFELVTDYCLISIAFSYIQFNLTRKHIYILTVLVSIIIGLFSGTRSFIFILLLFFILVFLFQKSYLKARPILILIMILTVGYYSYSFLADLPIFERLSLAIDAFNAGDYEKASNREYDKIPFLLNQIKFLGFGSYDFRALGDTVLPGHNFYINLILRYGFFSIMYLYLFFYYPLKILFKKIFNGDIINTVIFCLLICLIFQQFKINYLRDLNIMIMYVSLALITYNSKKQLIND